MLFFYWLQFTKIFFSLSMKILRLLFNFSALYWHSWEAATVFTTSVISENCISREECGCVGHSLLLERCDRRNRTIKKEYRSREGKTDSR